MAATRTSKAKPTAKPAKPAKPTKRSTTKSGRAKPADPIGAALAAVRSGPVTDAVAPLLAAWQVEAASGAGSQALADAIISLAARVKRSPEIRGKTKAAIAAWDALAASADPLAVGALLEALADVSSNDARERLARVARWGLDPRIDAAIVDLLHTIPYRATSTQPFWIRLFELAEQIRDRAQYERLATANAHGVAVTMGDWLRRRLAALRATLEERFREPAPSPDPRLAELVVVVGAPKLSGGSKNLEALLQAIYDNPEDDGPRLVYADALLERGDPRGEFINLQIAKSPDREAKRREKELFETHGKQWLGELAPIVMAGFTFERGFLASCRIENKFIDRVRALAGRPEWSTVHTIEGSATIALHPVMKALRRLSFVSWQARNHERLPESWKDLLIGTPRPIEALRYTGIESDRQWEQALEDNESIRPGAGGRWVYVPEAMEVAALCECSALPKLRELVLVDRPEIVVGPISTSKVIRQLHTLGFGYDLRNERRPPLEPVAALIASAPVPRLRFELSPDYDTTLVDIERGERGYAKLTMTVGQSSRGNWSERLINEAIAILDQMPESLREVRITTRRNTDKKQFARLRAAVAQMSRLEVADVG